jgi:hypothetical protein
VEVMDSDMTVFNKLSSGWGLAGSIAVAVTIKSESRIYVLKQRKGKIGRQNVNLQSNFQLDSVHLSVTNILSDARNILFILFTHFTALLKLSFI